MKPIKLKNGKWRIRPMINGRQMCFTFDYRPTKAEIDKIIIENTKTTSQGKSDRMSDCIRMYIESKDSILSPSTIKMYRSYLKNMPRWFLDLKLCDVNTYRVQSLINEYAKEYSVKYTRNVTALITATMRTFAPETIINTTLPSKPVQSEYRPSDDDIKRILAEAKGTMFEVALWLACFGLRRSEQICLTEDDLEGNVLTISKAKVQNANNEWIIKETKTAASVRQIILPDNIVDMIHRNGFYTGHPNSIVCWLYKTQDRLGIPRFPLHYFRHYYASKMSTIADEATVLELGGWKTDYVFKRNYRYAMPDNVEKAKTDATNLIKDLL